MRTVFKIKRDDSDPNGVQTPISTPENKASTSDAASSLTPRSIIKNASSEASPEGAREYLVPSVLKKHIDGQIAKLQFRDLAYYTDPLNTMMRVGSNPEFILERRIVMLFPKIAPREWTYELKDYMMDRLRNHFQYVALA